MSQDNEWLFDMMWELSDRALQADMPALATKLEEAMDTYLAENSADKTVHLVQIRPGEVPGTVGATKLARVGARMIHRLAARKPAAATWTTPRQVTVRKQDFVSSRALAGR